MNYIYIDEFILDEKYWKYEIGTVYYSRHDHLNSPFETYNTCANCSGALCDGCKYIVENSKKIQAKTLFRDNIYIIGLNSFPSSSFSSSLRDKPLLVNNCLSLTSTVITVTISPAIPAVPR